MHAPRHAADGFTLTELVVVIIIVTVLAAFAISRINTASFDTEGFANRAAAMVRYAQKLAVSQRRPVYVVTTATNIQLCYDAGCASQVREPPGTNPFLYPAPSGVTLSVASISFSPLGSSAGGAITVTGDVGRTITIEAGTGYVH